MALLFGLGTPHPIKNKRQKSYVSSKPQTKMRYGNKPTDIKTDVATKNSTYKNEAECTSGKRNCGVNLPPVATKVTGKKVKTPNVSIDTETDRNPKTATTTTSTPTIPVKTKKNIASY